MNKDELIHRIAHSMDPPVFEREGSQPPQGFFGSPEWWVTARHSRQKRATEAATAAIEAVRALGLAVVPRVPTAAMTEAGAKCSAPQGASSGNTEHRAREVWEVMLAEFERPEQDKPPEAGSGASEIPVSIRRLA